MLRELWQRLGSPRLALAGMAVLAIGAVLSYGNPTTTPVWVLVIPLAALAVNLLAAISTNPRIYRRRGLLVFHVGLLTIVLLAAVGRLTWYEGRVEVLEGSFFSAADVIDARHGVWHSNRLDQVQFSQGPFTVEYHRGLVRGLTHSHVFRTGAGGQIREDVVGDDRPLVDQGYRFYTTFNKGYAPILTWLPSNGDPAQTGAVHMPSYPLFAHKQSNEWIPPGTEKSVRFWLRLNSGLDENRDWVLNGQPVDGILVVEAGEQRLELRPGDSALLNGGTLRYERLSTWMGYKIFYDPTLMPLFFASIAAVIGLFVHFWGRMGLRLPAAAGVRQAEHGGVPGSTLERSV